jgi:UDP-3-O-[3-hydroxymyristoyl] glucosamine N-acyltransferase
MWMLVLAQQSIEQWGRLLLERSKARNQIQVAHNVEIGEYSYCCSKGIAGSTKIGKNCMIGGQVGIWDT